MRPCQPEEREFIYQLKKLCYESYVSKIWGWDEAVQRAYFDQFMQRAEGDLKILLVDGQRAGMLNGAVLDEGTFELENICLLPEFRGRGLGGRILAELVEGCGCQRVTLRVFKSNPAIHLYRRLGFEVTGETESHWNLQRTNEFTP